MKKLVLIIISFIIAFPIFLIVLLSFFSNYRYPLLLPNHFTSLFWINSIFKNSIFIESILSSLILGLLSSFGSTVVGIMTARALVRYDFKGMRLISTLFSLPLFIPSIALFIGIHLMMIKYGLVNTYTGVIIGHIIISIPYSISIFMAFFGGINVDMEETALTLGCKRLTLYRKIIMPLIMPGIYLSLAICFLISFSEYFSTFLIGGGRVITLSMIMYPYLNNGDLGNSSVLGVVFMTINILVFMGAEMLARKKLKIENYLFE